MMTAEAEAHIQTGEDLAKEFIKEQARRAGTAIAGERSGYELEWPVEHFFDLSIEEAIAIESEMTAFFIERWNAHIAEEPELANKPEFLLEAEEVIISPAEVERILADYQRLLDSDPNADEIFPEIFQGYERLKALRESGFSYVVAKNGVIHPDNPRLAELAAPPFQNAFEPASRAYSRIVEKTIAAVNSEFDGILHLHTCAVTDHGTYAKAYADQGFPLFSKKNRIPGADTPLSILMAARHLGLKNTSISNDGTGMTHGGQHVTVGLKNPKRLGDVLRVLTALADVLMVLSENNGLDPRFPVRALHGSWLGQNPANYPRMGAKFFNPNLTTEEIVKEYWEEIFNAPIIVEMELQGDQLVPVPVSPENFGKTVNQYMGELKEKYDHITGIDWDAVLRDQAKCWGVLRIREIPESEEGEPGSELLIEYRPGDTQKPQHALIFQAIIQAVAQDEEVLDPILNHYEKLGIIPRRGQKYTPEDLRDFESNLRYTALRALTGLDEQERPLGVQGLATPYLGNPRYTLSSTANFLQYVMRKAGQPKEVLDYLKNQTRAHAELAVAHVYSMAQHQYA